jgi:Kef-type K+ transport system membrane component KefB
MQQPAALPRELDYVLLLFVLFVVPRFLLRYRLPSGITAVAMGIAAGVGFGLFAQDRTVGLLATLGIVSLFLFAGLEVEFVDLRRGLRVLVQHVVIGLVMLAAVTPLVRYYLALPWRPAILVALALLTPSTGFILDSLASLEVSERERFWIKSKAVATELVALAALFVALQSTSAARLTSSALVLIGMIALLPGAFRLFAVRVAPFAPKSEFAFLLMLAVLCAVVTRWLGVYYLVGAFVVGVTAQRFRERLPAMASEQMLHAVEVFASFFVPFYFFNAGLRLGAQDFAWETLLVGVAFLGTMVPLRLALVAVHRRVALGEPMAHSMRVGAAMLPTLVFTLVIAEILAEQNAAPRAVFGGLVIYALGTTLIPGFALRTPPMEFLAGWETTGGAPAAPGPPGEGEAGEPRTVPRFE